MVKSILHIDMDAFFVSVEEVRDPSLKGKPVIVGGDPDGRGVVAAASYAVRKYGVHSAMPIARAKRLCPHAVFLRGSHHLYSEFSARIFDILDCYSPLVEPMSLDEAYVDLTGCERLHGPVTDTAQRMHDEILDRVGINASVGMAGNKLMAKIASGMAKPNGLLRILPGHEAAFLAPLPIGRIPGIGPKSGEEFKRMGIYTVRDLAQLPLELLEEVYGEWGRRLYEKARGISHSPVLKRDDTRSISRETTLEEDSTDPAFLESTLSWLVEKAASQLREEGLRARCVSLKLRYSDFKTVTRSHTLNEAACEDHIIFDTVVGLFRKLFTRRTRVRLVGVALTSLTSGAPPQMELFENMNAKQWQKLYAGIDRIRNKYGFRSIVRGSSCSAQGEL
ncbi:MAG: DNA polymerase IV [Nitrospinota bacterium]|nr:DNA polymerase IV [Nitrospinota bacterium]